MLRSGLMLSGGNRAWQGEKVSDSIEDGVLTAREISRMDLRGTDLVVLSACETALGEVSSEGVFGLQRSFKQAGVRTLVMSLWEVSDQATKYMMTEFYSNLLSGKDKRTAFLAAKRQCKEKFPEPQYWGAFIMLD
jgi:CHAT domain-containing protein